MHDVDPKAFHQFSYGVFLLSAREGDLDNACIINTAIQASSEPRQVSICCIKGTCTQEMIGRTNRFCVSTLTESTPYMFFEYFGMRIGNKVNKFVQPEALGMAGAHIARCESGLIYEASANAFTDCEVVSAEDLGSHVLYVGKAVEARHLSDDPSITYQYYRSVTRKDAQPDGADGSDTAGGRIVAWKCAICGYIYDGEQIPDDYICPICKHGAEDFEPVYTYLTNEEEANGVEVPREKEKEKAAMTTKWVCKVCGYIYEGEQPPAECPVCHAPASQFMKVEGEIELAAEHEYGVYGSTVKNNPDISEEDKAYLLEQLKANFTGECSEVGMYLCMARIAHREGYPEVGLYWEKAAYEEAEHAAKFAELLGSELEPNMKASTKENLAWRVDCEFGATAGKVELAACAKKNGLDAIHDTVHEMARDEARHGKALKGLLDRYFG